MGHLAHLVVPIIGLVGLAFLINWIFKKQD